MSDAEALLRAVYEAPEDDAPRLVYADWLGERGDPLGEFIHLQIARASGTKKRGTKKHEVALLEEHGKAFWRDHPGAFGGPPRWENTERGFPCVFSPGYPVSDLHAFEPKLAALAGAPGWATIREIRLTHELSPSVPAALLLESPLPSLRAVGGLSLGGLRAIAASALPIQELGVDIAAGTPPELPRITGLPHLGELTVLERGMILRAVDAVLETGVVDRLKLLVLRGGMGTTSPPIADALAALRHLPEALPELLVDQFYLQYTHLKRVAGKAPRLELSVTAREVEEAAQLLRALQKSAVSTLHVEFAEGGFFTKKNRVPFQELVEAATKKWGRAVTYGWRA